MAASDYEDYGPVAPSPTRTAIEILRARFPQLLRDNEDATLSYDPTGSLAVKNARDTRLGELSDRLVNDEASAAIPHEGYVQGEPGRRMRSNAPDVFNLLRTRGQLRNLGAEAAADPYTGEAEQGRVDDVRNALTTASLTTRPELEDAAHAVASRNAFADYMKQKGMKTGEYEARISPAGRQAAEVERDLYTAKQNPAPQTYFDSTGKAHTVQTVGGVMREIATPFGDNAGKANPVTSQERNRVSMAGSVLNQFDRVSTLVDQANAKGLLGPLSGRTINDLLGGTVGSTGDPEADRILGQLRVDMKALGSGFASLHGRGGANAGIGKEIEHALYQAKMSPDEIHGALQSLKSWTQDYAQGRNGVAPGETPAAPATGGGGGGATMRVIGPNGESGTVPAGTELPAGWRKQ